MPKRVPVTIRGRRHRSMVAAASFHGVTEGAVRAAARSGQAALDRVGLRGALSLCPVTVDGVTYPSRRAASRALGLPESSLR